MDAASDFWASKLDAEAYIFYVGRRAGDDWARSVAEYFELKRLHDAPSPPKTKDEFVQIIEADRGASAGDWNFGEDPEELQAQLDDEQVFIQGFADGAVDFFGAMLHS